MTPQNSLDQTGKFVDHPFAELLVEIRGARLHGSLRVNAGEKRSIFYFREGLIVYGVSNRREHRLLSVLLNSQNIDRAALGRLPKCNNDIELRAALIKSGLMSKEEIDRVIGSSIEKIIIDVLSWTDGEWHFSPLVRSREDLFFPVGCEAVLLDFARCLPSGFSLSRIRSMGEKFQRRDYPQNEMVLQSHEDYVLKRFETEPRKIEDLILECGLPENGFLQTLYVLWLAGMLERLEWNSAFSANKLSAMRAARLAVVKEAQRSDVETMRPAAETKPAEAVEEPAAETEGHSPGTPEISLTEYLERTESAKTHYDVLGIAVKAPIAEIKSSYLSLAKSFHPDRFHREDQATQQRIQNAFSSVQVAYETLKSADSRENYDYKVRKELELKEKLRAQSESTGQVIDQKAEHGLENFEVGLGLLMDEEYEKAVPFLGRAAHYNPDNALYRAYFGKALSFDEKQRHKAEGELQTAVKLDPKNPKIRLMLVDFLIERKLMKRAEGELKRFLELVPDNPEAKKRLEKIQA